LKIVESWPSRWNPSSSLSSVVFLSTVQDLILCRTSLELVLISLYHDTLPCQLSIEKRGTDQVLPPPHDASRTRFLAFSWTRVEGGGGAGGGKKIREWISSGGIVGVPVDRESERRCSLYIRARGRRAASNSRAGAGQVDFWVGHDN